MSTEVSHATTPLKTGRRFLIALATAAVLCLHASPAMAAKGGSDDDEVLPDGRLMGYETPMTVAGGTMMTYTLLGFLGVLAIGVTFKSANRSHLD